jgi:hypothetical protein
MLAGALVSLPDLQRRLDGSSLERFPPRLASRSTLSCSPLTALKSANFFLYSRSRECLSPIFFIFVQTRMQVFATSPAAMYTGIGNAFTRISSTEGVRALWRGVSSVIVGAGPAHAVHFGTYEAVKELTGGNREGNVSPWLSARKSPLIRARPSGVELMSFEWAVC